MEILVPIIIGLLLTAFLMPWINHTRIDARKNEINALKEELRRLEKELKRRPNPEEPQIPEPNEDENRNTETPRTGTEHRQPKSIDPAPPEESTEPSIPLPSFQETGHTLGASEAKISAAEPEPPKDQIDWFGRIAVWVGGVALLMAGFYMVKYSIDTGLLTPAVRLWLTTGFGLALIIVGFITSIRSKLQVSTGIGQALSGAGIACLYFAAYAAVHLYDFIPSSGGFIAMAAVTLLAVVLSLKHGPPIALMGFIGGFLTPWIMSDNSGNTPALFSYLFIIYSAAQFLCLRRGWTVLMLVSVAGAYLWTGAVMTGYIFDTLPRVDGALFFVMGVCATSTLWGRLSKNGKSTLLRWLQPLTWAIGLLQGLLLVWIGEFSTLDMSLFAVLGAGALALAVKREETFGWAGWMAYAFILIGTLVNPDQAAGSYYGWALGFAALFAATGHWQASRENASTQWRQLSLFSLLSILPVIWINRELIYKLPPAIDWAWLAASGPIAMVCILAAAHLRRTSDFSETLEGQYNVAAFLVLGLGLWDFAPAEYLTHCIAGLLIVACIYWSIRKLSEFSLVSATLAGAWTVTMVLPLGSALPHLLGIYLNQPYTAAPNELSAWLVGAVSIIGACFNKNLHGFARIGLGWIAGISSIFAFSCAYTFFTTDADQAVQTRELISGGLTTLLAISAIVASILANKRSWPNGATYLLAGLTGIRLLTLHILGDGAEGSSFFTNALMLQFGIPCITAWLLALTFSEGEREGPRKFFQSTGMLLGFIWASFLVRDYFGHSSLYGKTYGSTELYAYSVVWLVLAVCYQALGLLRKAPVIHFGSLILLLLTTGKVFLVDAAELQGLFRVLSFLGLGLALLGIGYFYNKVVFQCGSATNDTTHKEGPKNG